jgi:hypothetical protein
MLFLYYFPTIAWVSELIPSGFLPKMLYTILIVEPGYLSRHTDGLRSVWQEIFFYRTAPRWTLGPTQPSMQQISGTLSPGVKRPPSSAEVKKWWSCTSTPTYVFMGWCFINYAHGNFIFTF